MSFKIGAMTFQNKSPARSIVTTQYIFWSNSTNMYFPKLLVVSGIPGSGMQYIDVLKYSFKQALDQIFDYKHV